MTDQPIKTECLLADTGGVARAAMLLRAGKLVAFPTETVYGLGADATNDAAVAGIFRAKNRPEFNPLILHVGDAQTAARVAEFNDTARLLAFHFWPGPLTLVLPRRAGAASSLVSAGLDTVALRVPDHPVARAVLTAVGGPVAAPSANPSGRISPTSAAHVMSGLSGRIDAVLDGGAAQVGVESTILAVTAETPVLLRPGGLAVEDIEHVLGRGRLLSMPSSGTCRDDRPISPGQLGSHYAPHARVELDAQGPADGAVLLGFGPVKGADLNLSEAGDLTEAAANLFAMLRHLDSDANGRVIRVAPVPEHGLGRAINDRLRRAAAPR